MRRVIGYTGIKVPETMRLVRLETAVISADSLSKTCFCVAQRSTAVDPLCFVCW